MIINDNNDHHHHHHFDITRPGNTHSPNIEAHEWHSILSPQALGNRSFTSSLATKSKFDKRYWNMITL